MPRIRFWAGLALIVAIAKLSVGVSAQDKAAPADATDKVDIRWRFEKDKKIYQELNTKTTQNMKVMGMEVNQTQEQTFFFSWELKDEDKDKNITLLQRIEGVKLKIEIAGNPISYDSTTPTTTSTPLAEFFRQLVGTEFKLTLDKDMRVTKVEGREEFLKKLGQTNQQIEPLLKRVLNEEALKQMADPTFGLVSGRPVGKGDTWTREARLNLGPIGSYKNVYKFTLESIDKGIAKIKVDSSLTYEPPTETAEGLPFRIKAAKLSSKDSGGMITFDTNRGRLEKSEIRVKLEGELDIEISSTNTKVELKQDQVTTITTSDTSPIKSAEVPAKKS